MCSSFVTQPDVHAHGGFRARWLSAAVLAVTVTLGLLSRRFPLPGILAEYTGDALYTVAAFFGLALLLPAARTRSLAVLALAFSVAIELSQLLTWPWLGELRATRLGGLVLGQGYQWADLLAYLIGATLAAVLDANLPGQRVLRA